MSRLPPHGLLDGLPPTVTARALWWEWHILEVLRGLPPEAAPGTPPRPQFDPRLPVAERDAAKAAELTAAGTAVSARSVRRRRQNYQDRGLLGLVDQRALRQPTAFGRADQVVVEAMRAAINEAADASTRTASFILWRTAQILAEQYGAEAALPSERTLYRLFAALSRGKHVTGSARARRSLANRPQGVFSELPASAPGELMQIDSTPLDALVLLDDGVAGRVELTGMVDVATRSITAAVLRPTTKAADASALLARTIAPEPMRPGWPEALRMSRSVLPHRALVDIDARMEHAAARPVIIPETIVCDHGKVFVSQAFRASCRFLGINFQPARKGTPTDKPHIERTILSVGTLFTQFLSGYVGRGVEHRGRAVENEPLWTLTEVQDLLDEWIVTTWQNRPHDALRDPLAPGRAFTPNEKYAALVETAGYLPVALGADDYIELLPAKWQSIGPSGVRINRRTYDSAALDELGLRGQPSGITARKGKWQIHHDPYDISRVWVRDHHHGGWVMLLWKHLRRSPVPFGELAWDHARRTLPDGTEEELADAAASLLQRANKAPAAAGELGKREKRVAAKAKATQPRTPPPAPALEPEPEPEPDTDNEPLAKVIPLGIFDPFEEARKRW
jgi:putative transposase